MQPIAPLEFFFVFLNILLILFVLAIPVAIVFLAVRFSQRLRNLEGQVKEMQDLLRQSESPAPPDLEET